MATARYDFNLTENEFFELTPAQFDAMTERHVMHRQMEDYRAGLIAAILVNINKSEKSKAMEPADFFNSLPRSEPKEMTGAEMLAHLKAVFPQGAP